MSLLDLHPDVPDPNRPREEKLEIFEAGTGHGALTLNLSRAIHVANTAAPPIPAKECPIEEAEVWEVQKEAYNTWRNNRNAIIHTLDISGEYQAHAQKVVKNFRSGMYFPHVDFHVSTINDYLTSRLKETNGAPFLDHAILDLPSTHSYLEIISKALKPDGTLITFCPSITQINQCVLLAKEEGMPLFLERVLEVGAGVGVGGREWDVRPVKPRAVLKAQEAAKAAEEEATSAMDNTTESLPAKDEGWELVCRPKVGIRVAGGGFLGLWKKIVLFKKDEEAEAVVATHSDADVIV